MNTHYDFINFNNLDLINGTGSIAGDPGHFRCKKSLDGSESSEENWMKVQGIFQGAAVECFIKIPEDARTVLNIQRDTTSIEIAHRINDFIIDRSAATSPKEKIFLKFLMHHNLSVEDIKMHPEESATILFGSAIEKGNLLLIRSKYSKLLSINSAPDQEMNKKIIEDLYKLVLTKSLPNKRDSYNRVMLCSTAEGLQLLNSIGSSMGPARFKRELDASDDTRLWKKIDATLNGENVTGYFYVGTNSQRELNLTEDLTPKEISQKINDFLIDKDPTLSTLGQKEEAKAYLHLGLSKKELVEDPIGSCRKLFGLEPTIENLDLIKDKYNLILSILKPEDTITKKIIDLNYKEAITEALGLNDTNYSELNLKLVGTTYKVIDFLENEKDDIEFKPVLSAEDDRTVWKKIRVVIDLIPQDGYLKIPKVTQGRLGISEEQDPKKIARAFNDFYMENASCTKSEKAFYTQFMKLGITVTDYESGPIAVGTKLLGLRYNEKKMRTLKKRVGYFRELAKLIPENRLLGNIIDYIDPEKLSSPDNPFVSLFLKDSEDTKIILKRSIDLLSEKLKTQTLDQIYHIDTKRIIEKTKLKFLYELRIYKSEDPANVLPCSINNLIQFSGLEDVDKLGLNGNFSFVPSLEIMKILQETDFPEISKEDKDELIESLSFKLNPENSSEKTVERIQEEKPVFISTGFAVEGSGHHIELIFYKNTFVICNRGFRETQSDIFERFEYDPTKLDEKFLDYLDIIYHAFRPDSIRTYQNISIYEVFPKALEATRIKSSIVAPKVIPAKDQVAYNCTKASTFAAVKMQLYLKKFEETGSHVGAARYSKTVGNKISYLLRKKSIDRVEDLISRGMITGEQLPKVQTLIEQAKRKLAKKLPSSI